MILFKGVRLKPSFCDNLPNGCKVSGSTKGSMTTKKLRLGLVHFLKYKPKGKVLLILDGAKSHLDVTR